MSLGRRCLAAVPSELLIPQCPASHDRVVLALGFHKRIAILGRGRDIGVPHQFLLHADRCARIVQPRPVGVTERVPAYVVELAPLG